MSDTELSTFDEALAYLRPHKLTNGDAPVILKAGMLRCCVSAILMREADLLSRLTAAEAGREEAESSKDRLAIEAARLEIQRDAAIARAEKLEKALQALDLKLDFDPETAGIFAAINGFDDDDGELREACELARSALTEAQPKGDQ